MVISVTVRDRQYDICRSAHDDGVEFVEGMLTTVSSRGEVHECLRLKIDFLTKGEELHQEDQLVDQYIF